MNAEEGFEIATFNWTPVNTEAAWEPEQSGEYGEPEGEEESERGRRAPARKPVRSPRPVRPSSRSPRPRPATGSRPGRAAPIAKKPRPPRPVSPRPPVRPPLRPWPADRIPVKPVFPDTSLLLPVEPFPAQAGVPASERVRWAQDCLNKVLNLQLRINGVMDVETRSALRSFQKQQRIRVTGIMGPDTEDKLKEACRVQEDPVEGPADPGSDAGPEEENEGFSNFLGNITSGISSTFGRAADMVRNVAGTRIIDLTAKADKSMRKGKRDPKTVTAVVLHQMACCFKPKDPLKRFLKLGAHFAVLPDGRILQLHPVTALVWASNGFNKRSVAIEFAGNFPSTRGRWWKGESYGKNLPTRAQIEAGRYLVRYLKNTAGLTHVLAHRQSSGTRENDPGPDIWAGVGQWAVNKLAMRDGGPGFRIGSGNPIPDEWRKWKRAGLTDEVADVFENEYAGDSQHELPIALKQALTKIPSANRPVYKYAGTLRDAPDTQDAVGPGLYLIRSSARKGKHSYSGHTDNLKRRLQQHRLCGTMLAVPLERYRVYIAKMPLAQITKQQRRTIEKTLHQNILSKPGHRFTNQRKEIEAELLGSGWF